MLLITEVRLLTIGIIRIAAIAKAANIGSVLLISLPSSSSTSTVPNTSSIHPVSTSTFGIISIAW